jgi:hypothetical protein
MHMHQALLSPTHSKSSLWNLLIWRSLGLPVARHAVKWSTWGVPLNLAFAVSRLSDCEHTIPIAIITRCERRRLMHVTPSCVVQGPVRVPSGSRQGPVVWRATSSIATTDCHNKGVACAAVLHRMHAGQKPKTVAGCGFAHKSMSTTRHCLKRLALEYKGQVDCTKDSNGSSKLMVCPSGSTQGPVRVASGSRLTLTMRHQLIATADVCASASFHGEDSTTSRFTRNEPASCPHAVCSPALSPQRVRPDQKRSTSLVHFIRIQRSSPTGSPAPHVRRWPPHGQPLSRRRPPR